MQTVSTLPTPKYLEIIKNFILIIGLYLYIFQPPVINKHIYIYVEFIIFGVYTMFERKHLWSYVRMFRFEHSFAIAIILYCLVRDVFSGQEIYVTRFAAWYFQAFVFGYFIVVLAKKNEHRNQSFNLLTTVYWTTFLAAALTLLLILVKPLDSFYSSIQLDDFDRYADFDFRYRAYGISENLTFTYSVVLGLFAGYTITVINKNWLLIIPLLLFLVGVFYNARIGFFPIIFSLVAVVWKGKLKNIVLLLMIGGGFLMLFASVFRSEAELLLSNSKWVFSFFYDISDALFGTTYATQTNRVSTIDVMFGDFIIFPPDLFSWIFGTGESLFEKPTGQNSDIGYIIQLYYGGIILLSFILFFMVYVFRRIIKELGLMHWYSIVFVASLLVLNFKGFIFAATPGGRLLFFLYVYFIVSASYEKKFSMELRK